MFQGLFDRVVSARFPLAALLVGLAGAGVWSAASIGLDMSFRPLFEDEPQELAATREFERVFGQLSGAHVGAVLEHPEIFSDGFQRDLAALTERVAQLEGVAEVRSLTHRPIPLWTDGELRIGEVDDPRALGMLLAQDGGATLLWARLEAPLEDLAARQPTVAALRVVLESHAPAGTDVHLVGISVVEDAYARLVLEGLALSIGLSTVVIVAVLWLLFGQLQAVLVALSGVSLALPMTVGVMRLCGWSLTMVNSMVATLVLVIGVADAIHMVGAFVARRERGEDPRTAGRGMFADTGLACLMTTLTTMAGFLSLRLAGIGAIRDFGTLVAIGIALVYLSNVVAVPNLLLLLPPRTGGRTGRISGALDRALDTLRGLVLGRPAICAVTTGALFLAGIAAIPSLQVRQKFNEDLPPAHPVRAAQVLLEERFGGILGPEIDLRHTAGGTLLDDDALGRVDDLRQRIAERAGVTDVHSHVDLVAGVPADQRASFVAALRNDPELGFETRALIDGSGARAALVVRVRDIGTEAARELVEWIEREAPQVLGADYEVAVVGQWWLAQRGMARLLLDMITSFLAACVLVLPFLALALRDVRLFLIGLLPNLLPVLFVLGFMAWAGITLRIGTAMILAIALGIAIDDTIHLLLGIARERRAGRTPREAADAAMAHAGRAILVTTVILAAGFASMTTNGVLAIRDMGLVGAVALVAALLADVLLAPSLYLLVTRRSIMGARNDR